MTSARARRHRPRGVAAVEFAFVLTGLLLLLHGLLTFGSAFYIRQAMARATEDGVRAIAVLPGGAAPDAQRVRDVVLDTLADSLVVPSAFSDTTASRRRWVAAYVQVGVAVTGRLVTVTVSHRYGDNPLMALAGSMPWLPDVMTYQATMVRPA